MKKVFRKWFKHIVFLLLASCQLMQQSVYAAGPPVPSEMSNPMAQLLVGIIVALLLVIVLLAFVVTGAAELYLERFKESGQSSSGNTASRLLLLVFALVAAPAMAQGDTSGAAVVPALSDTSLYTLIAVMLVELGVIFYMLINLRFLLSKEKQVIKTIKPSFSFAAWWEQFNRFRPVQEEANIDLGHDYDGIRELDNRLPPWWLYGFYACILFGVIYLYRY
ncbi:MAG: cbb3-type cytochrome c oxidase N-terminal domain-containing protein, partial [Bacteroidota bacterium]